MSIARAGLLPATLLLALLLVGCAAIRARQDAKWNAQYSWITWPTNR